MIDVNVIGAGGHARSLLSLMEERDLFNVKGIYDNSFSSFPREIIGPSKLLGSVNELHNKQDKIVLAVGKIKEKIDFAKEFKEKIYLGNIISDQSLIRKDVKLGTANHIFPFVFLNSEVTIGHHCLINSRATVEHESKIGDFCHISVGAIICGRVCIGDNVFIGAGSVIKDGVNICNDVTIGAGSVVIKDIMIPGTYVGNPIRKIK